MPGSGFSLAVAIPARSQGDEDHKNTKSLHTVRVAIPARSQGDEDHASLVDACAVVAIPARSQGDEDAKLVDAIA